MGMNETPSAERVHIGFFGCRNAGKSSLLNAVANQKAAVVSPEKGTTTDPVRKTMELAPLGPVVLIDTPGIDDEGELGALRVQRAEQELGRADIAVLVVDSTAGICEADERLITLFQENRLPYLIAWNKADLDNERKDMKEGCPGGLDSVELLKKRQEWGNPVCLQVSAVSGEGIETLKEAISNLKAEGGALERPLVEDLIEPSDFVVLVIPIDKAAPKGRLILPQQQTIRKILDRGAVAVTAGENELGNILTGLGKRPKLVITDSQIFGSVSRQVPEDIALTSFSILFARYKGSLEASVKGAMALETLQEGDRILISEGCTHHRQCGDIGTEKLPAWIQNYVGKKISFSFTQGMDFPKDLSDYHMVIHCGGCMLNEKEMKNRIKTAARQQIPMTNYGIVIAHINGILKRSIGPFEDVSAILSGK